MASDEPGPVRNTEERELRKRVLAAIEALRPVEREVTSLFYVDGYSMAEVGAFLGVPVSTVKSRLHRARGKLKEGMMDLVADVLRKNAPDPDEMSEQLAFRWKLDVEAETMRMDGNRALVANKGTVLLDVRTDSHRPELTAVDAETGAIRWSRPCWFACFGFNEALDGETFYIGAPDGPCLALSVRDGSELWRSDVPNRISTAVAMDADRVYFGADGFLYALDRRDGGLVWRSEVAPHLLIATPMAVGDTVTVLDQHNAVRAYAADTGKLLWEHILDTHHWTVVLPSARTTYAAAQDALLALDRTTGAVRWRKDSYTGVLYDRERQLPHFRLAPATFAAFDEDTGEAEGTLELPVDGRGEIIGDRIHLVNGNTYFALDRQDRSLQWQFAADSPLHPPAVVGQSAYLLSRKGMLYAFPGPLGMRRGNASEARAYLMRKARVHADAGKSEQAVATYRNVIENVEPGSADAWFGLALAYEEPGSTHQAAPAWRKCLGLMDRDDAGLPTARQRLAVLDGANWVNKSHVHTDDLQVNAGRAHVFGDQRLLVMDATTGDDLCATELTDGLCSQAARFADDLILAPVFSTGVRALDRETLDTRWEVPVGAGVCNATVAGSYAYITTWNLRGNWEGGGVIKVDLASGEVIWQREIGIGSIGSPPTVAGEMVFASFAEAASDGGVYALNATDGAVIWVRRDPPRRMACRSGIVHRDGVLYANAEHPDAAAYAFDADSGEIIWRRALHQYPSCPVMVCEDSVFTADGSTLCCIDAASGSIRWECSGLPRIARVTHVERVGRHVLLGGEEALHVVDAQTGRALRGVSFEGQRLWHYCTEGDTLYVAVEHCIMALPLSEAVDQPDPGYRQA